MIIAINKAGMNLISKRSQSPKLYSRKSNMSWIEFLMGCVEL